MMNIIQQLEKEIKRCNVIVQNYVDSCAGFSAMMLKLKIEEAETAMELCDEDEMERSLLKLQDYK